MFCVNQFRELVIFPALHYMGLYSQAAENLLVGTALVESRLEYLHQIGDGPALGVYQIEPNTHDDVWDNFLKYRPELRDKALMLLSNRATFELSKSSDLIGNLSYATAIARLIYFRKPEPLPDKNNIHGLAEYWKEHYNTRLGAGNSEKFYNRYIEFGGR